MYTFIALNVHPMTDSKPGAVFSNHTYSRGKIGFNPQKIATKGFSTAFGRFEYTFQHTKSLPKFDLRKSVFFKMAAKMDAKTF